MSDDTWWVEASELDDRQKSVIDIPLTQSHMIIGPPGSGKTNLLLLRASQMVHSGKPNVLILVFNRTLREFIATGGNQYAFEPDKIQTLNSWEFRFIRDHGLTPEKCSSFEDERQSHLKQIMEILSAQQLSNMYDAIILDETQDYLPEELDIFFRLGKVVFAAADKRQKIYATNGVTSQEYYERFSGNLYELKHHYRNGQNICLVADKLGEGWEDFCPLSPTCNYSESRRPSSVTEHNCDNLEEQFEFLVENLKLQLKAYPNDFLAVLCPTREVLKDISEFLSKSEIGDLLGIQSASDGYFPFTLERPICVSTIHGAKGLEFRTVHIIDAGSINKSPLNRNIAYMATTRAKTSLTFYYEKKLPGYLDSALTAIRPPVNFATLEDLFKGE